MTEKLPVDQIYIDCLMKYFDAIIVPHVWLINNYKDSGFSKPIFCIPLGISLKDNFLDLSKKDKEKTVFGFTGSSFNNKNHEKLIKIFLETFKNIDGVELLIHSALFNGREEYINNLKKYESLDKVKIIDNVFTDSEYKNFLTSLDFFISLSNGEGYSLTCREALSLGIPCILTKSTGHLDLINNKNVIGIDTIYENNCWEPLNESVKKQLIYGYENKEKLIKKAFKKKDFYFNKYQWKTIVIDFINFIKPKKILYGYDNLISNEYLMTSDINFYKKIKFISDN